MKRGRNGEDVVDAVENVVVTDHYSNRPNQGRQRREESPIFRLRAFNNWVKSVLISKYCSSGDSVFDLAGGKGGDLKKWEVAHIAHLLLSDGAAGSVEHALERYQSSVHGKVFPALFVVADCFGKRLFVGPDSLDPAIRFNLVSCQFAFHYAFETEQRLRRALENITDRLVPGGYFIGTVPNANRLVKLLRSVDGYSWGNSVCSLEFDQKIFGPDKKIIPAFGARYTFRLTDAVDTVPEYLVHFEVLKRIAGEYQLDLVLLQDFAEVYATFKDVPQYANLLRVMKVTDPRTGETLSQDEWQAAWLYVMFAFQKRPEAVAGDEGEAVAAAAALPAKSHDYSKILRL